MPPARVDRLERELGCAPGVQKSTNDLADTVAYALERVEESRELILNVKGSSRQRTSSMVTRSKARKESLTEETEEDLAKKRKAEAAAKRRKQILAQMSAQQSKFAKENASALEVVETGLERSRGRASECEGMDAAPSAATKLFRAA